MSVIPPPSKATALRAAEIEIEGAMAHLGRYVREFRTEAMSLTQQDLAEAAGVDRNTISRLEAGQFVSLEVLLRVWRALGVLPNVLTLLADQDALAIQTARALSRKARTKAGDAPQAS